MATPAQLTPEQRKVLRTIQQVGSRKRATPMELKAAVETGLTETNLRNLNYGDGSSIGWRQETKSSYPNVNRLDLASSVGRFFDEVKGQRGKYGTAGDLAQAVQRSAYPGRYNQNSAQANSLLRGVGDAKQPTNYASSGTVPDNRQQIALSLLGMGNLGGGYGGQDLTSQLLAAQQKAPAPQSYRGGSNLQGIVARANQVNSEHLPYQWGGGHGPTPAKPGVPLDCSGAVSRVLGVNPRVSGQFAKWGAPGRGKGLTVYANGKHVLMEVNGHFFGTSATNPKGGAGWIPRSAISDAYLKNFTARHLPGR